MIHNMDQPDADNGACEWLVNPMNEAQQVQLRAQIIVVGSILRDRVPEETLMNLCFADISQGQTLEAFNEDNFRRTMWENSWQTCSKTKARGSAASFKPPPNPPPPPPPPPKKPSSSRPPPKSRKAEKELENLAVSVLTHDFVEEKTSGSEATHLSDDVSENVSDSDDEPPEQPDLVAMFPVGASVEVLAVEDGLNGVWFEAKVTKVEDNIISVRYDALLTEEEPKPKDRKSEKLKSSEDIPEEMFLTEDVEWGDDPPRIRLAHPVTSAHVPITQKPYNLGDRVDKWWNDGWWEGEVQGINSDNNNEFTLYYPAEGDNGRADLSVLRPSLVWKDGEWVTWTREVSKKVSKRKKTMSTRSLEGKKKKVEAAPPTILNGKRKREKPKWLRDDVNEEEEDEEEDEEIDEDDNGRAVKRVKSERVKKKPVRKSKRR